MLDIRPDIAEAIRQGRPVVALESTLITHGLPWPINLATARGAEAAVQSEGAIPATIAVWQGRPTVGLSDIQLEQLALSRREGSPAVRKASRRDLAAAVTAGAFASTTVAATMYLAHRAGLRIFATGGIGGVHPRHMTEPPDVSPDLAELARTPVAVVCAGAKSILDLPATLEMLESLGVPVVGYGTNDFPAFYLRSSGLSASSRVDRPEEAAALAQTHWELDGAGLVIAQPLPSNLALDPAQLANAMSQAETEASQLGIRGPERTPFLLRRLAELTAGRTLEANRVLIENNARLAARIAIALSQG